MRCRSCSLPVPDGARFCPNCGLPQFGADEGDRRIVTILFADIVGFTALADGRDPEQVKRIVEDLFVELRRVIEVHGGIIDKVLGDGIIALFGAPIAHEDDPDRAVRAGVAMQEALSTARVEHPADDVRMRIGINTGEVLVGTIAGSDYTAMGDSVNTAARLQELAPVDTVLVADATRQLCSDAVRFVRHRQVRLRGRGVPTTTWIATSVDAGRPRRRSDDEIDFVGRRAELAMLDTVGAALANGRSAIVSITGEAGIGKSRLAAELVESVVAVRGDTVVLERSCAPYGDTSVWWPVAGGIIEQLRLEHGIDDASARTRIAEQLAAAGTYERGTVAFDRATELIAHLLGIPSELDGMTHEATSVAVVDTVVSWIEPRARRAPVILRIDDVHWASPALFELLRNIARNVVGLPVLVVTTARTDPDLHGDWPPVLPGVVSMGLALEPLPLDDAARLARGATPMPLSDETVASIVSRSGGNPLYVIELARATARGGELPVSLRALIAARLDRLPPAARQIIDNAAIIGNEGWVDSLRDFAAELDERFDESALAEVADTGLLDRFGDRWRFRSDLVREVAYEMLTKVARAQRHAGVARYLAVHQPQLIDRRAHHAATAAELVRDLGGVVGVDPDIARDAAELLCASSASWMRQGAARRAESAARRGLGLSEPGSEVRRRLMLAEANAIIDLHELPRAEALLGELVEIAESAGDRSVHAEVHRLCGAVARLQGDLVGARRHLALAVDELREIGDEDRLTEAIRARGFAEIFGGSLADAEVFLAEAELRSRAVDDPHGVAWALQHRAWVAFVAGDHDRATTLLDEALLLFERVGDRRGRAWSLGLLGYVMFFDRRNDDALRVADAAIDEAVRWEDEWGSSMIRNLQANVSLWRGDVVVARDSASRALSGFRRIDDRFGMLQALATLNRAHVALGRFADAERSIEELIALADSFGALAYAPLAAAGAEMHLGRGGRAAELARRATERLDVTGASLAEAHVTLAFGLLLGGDPEGALATLDEIDAGATPFGLAARATARVLTGDLDGALADADAVASMRDVSYWDAGVAEVAGAAVDPDRRPALADAAERIDDVVIGAYVRRFLDRADDRPVRDASIGQWAELADTLADVGI